MVSAVCPACNILLVEADDDTGDGLYIAINAAAASPGVVAISIPFGRAETSSDVTAEQTYLNHPGIAITAPGGFSGYGVLFPASSQYVVAVGGTTLAKAVNARGWTETVWKGANGATGSGCSAYIDKPSFQSDVGCSKRTANDVAAIADPGVAFYSQADGGLGAVAGTNVSSAIIAAIYALAGPATFPGRPASYLYRHAGQLNDVTTGNDGTCGGSYLCTAAQGYDGPTGNGTPNGSDAFTDDTIFANGFDE
jgi:subtilase family serine protease